MNAIEQQSKISKIEMAVYANESIKTFLFPSLGTERLRIIAFPFAGGNALAYREFAALLPADISLLSIELPGHTLTKGALYEDCHSLCNYLIEHLPKSLFESQQIILFGCSLGGYLACQMASLLKTHYNRKPNIVILAASPSSHINDSVKLSTLASDELIKYLTKAQTIPHEILENPEFLSSILDILYNDFRVFESFKFSSTISDLNALILGGVDDLLVNSESLFNWNKYFKQPIIDFVPGNHLFILTHPKLVIERMKSHQFI